MPKLHDNKGSRKRKTYNVLLAGMIGAGKSSLVNSLRSVSSHEVDKTTAPAAFQATGTYSTTKQVLSTKANILKV